MSIIVKHIDEEFENSSLFKTIIENIPGGVAKIILEDDKIRPIFFSDGMCNMLNDTKENLFKLYSEDAMTGVHPDDYDRVWNTFSRSMQTGEPINSIYRISNSKGEYRWVNNRSSFVSEENGIISYYVIYIDVTEDIKNKEAQTKTEAQLIAAMEHTDIIFWEYYFETNLCVNGFKSVRDLGMDKYIDDYPECAIRNGYIHKDSIDDYRKMHERIKSGESRVELDVKVNKPDGVIEWKRVKYSAIFDQWGKSISALGTSEDITQQKNAEQRYHQAERYRQVLDAKSVGSFKLNLTQNVCENGHSSNPSIMKFLEAKTVDGFF
ncbi:MAG: PAS domain-containing protein [Erysipelotrichaceae bacterium]